MIYCQSQSDFEHKRSQLKLAIKKLGLLLKETSEQKTTTINDVRVLTTQIQAREDLITSIKKELSSIEKSISKNEESIVSLESDLSSLEENYKQIVRKAFRTRNSFNNMLFVFSASGFNEAFRRWQYLKEYESYRKKQVLLLLRTKSTLEEKVTLNEEKKEEKEDLLDEELCIRELVNAELAEKETMLQKLQQNEKKLRLQLAKQKEADLQLKNRINQLIGTEIASSYEKEKTVDNTASSTDIKSESSISSLFKSKKGKFNWPVNNGVITGKYGKQPHPIFKTIMTFNSGIDIQPITDTEVQTICRGEVIDVFFVPGNQNAVMIKHGEYYTVYSNLYETYVNPGDQLEDNQKIGRLNTDVSAGKPSVHFEVWKNKTRQDPLWWISKN